MPSFEYATAARVMLGQMMLALQRKTLTKEAVFAVREQSCSLFVSRPIELPREAGKTQFESLQ